MRGQDSVISCIAGHGDDVNNGGGGYKCSKSVGLKLTNRQETKRSRVVFIQMKLYSIEQLKNENNITELKADGDVTTDMARQS